jgi:hypothetical protein
VPVRVSDPSGSHCIDATSEDVTLYVRRIFTEKKGGLFTTDNRAGVIVTATLTGSGSGPSQKVQIPSVNLVSVQDDKPGRVSLALEYQIAAYLTLNQNKLVATDLDLAISLAKTQGLTTFGNILDIAGTALGQLPIPNNPFEDAANKILAFANAAIKSATGTNSVPFAQVSLAFNKGKETDLAKCESAGKERTGTVAVILSTGLGGANHIPTQNTNQLYCFKYSSDATYELLAAKKTNGSCPTDNNAYQGVTNDYVMFILSATPTAGSHMPTEDFNVLVNESLTRCEALHIEAGACGIRK